MRSISAQRVNSEVGMRLADSSGSCKLSERAMTTKPFSPFAPVLALCLAGLPACGGIASANKQSSHAASGAPGIAGAAGTSAADLSGSGGSAGNSGNAGNSFGGLAAAQGGAPAVGGEQGSAGALVDAGSFACGATTCAVSQICVIRQCGGGPVECMAEADGGCPTGWHTGACPSGPFGNQSVCVPEPCTPPPAQCVDAPTPCATAVDCQCINQSSICQGPGCLSVNGRQVTCAGAE
jgi:hypothetical protein